MLYPVQRYAITITFVLSPNPEMANYYLLAMGQFRDETGTQKNIVSKQHLGEKPNST